MKAEVLLTLICLVPLAVAQQPSCVTVDGDQITGRDFARALPVFAPLPPTTPLAPTPLPGALRVFHLSEMQSIGSRFSVRIDSAPDICFRTYTEPLTQERALAVMHESLGIADAIIEVTELSTEPVPHGRLEFPRDHLGTPASPDRRLPVLWRGVITYAGDRRFPVWAKVWITSRVSRVVATETLRQGIPIQPTQLRQEAIESFPMSKEDLAIDRVAGLMPLHAISAGNEVRAENLVRPNDVNKGDLVRVEVHMGAARLELNGRAEATGRVGDFIAVLNPESSRTFQARIAGKDSVIVEPIGGN
jgi:flagella basal body P-ring formation protein FlgA